MFLFFYYCPLAENFQVNIQPAGCEQQSKEINCYWFPPTPPPKTYFISRSWNTRWSWVNFGLQYSWGTKFTTNVKQPAQFCFFFFFQCLLNCQHWERNKQGWSKCFRRRPMLPEQLMSWLYVNVFWAAEKKICLMLRRENYVEIML